MTNEEIIRAGYATFNRGDWLEVPEFFADNAVIDGSVAFIGPVTYRGKHGALGLMNEIEQLFESFTAQPIELVAEDNCVLCVADLSGRLKVSGRQVHDREIHLWRLRDEKIVNLRVYRDRAEAEQAMAEAVQAAY